MRENIKKMQESIIEIIDRFPDKIDDYDSMLRENLWLRHNVYLTLAKNVNEMIL